MTTQDPPEAYCGRCGQPLWQWPDGVWLDRGLDKYCHPVDEQGVNLIRHAPGPSPSEEQQ